MSGRRELKKGEPMIDEDAYPNAAQLRRIRTWPYSDPLGLLAFVKSLWSNPESGWRESDVVEALGSKSRTFQISTAGWSGNELLMEALQANRLFWTFCWWSSRRGGHFEFHVPMLLQGAEPRPRSKPNTRRKKR